MSYETIGYEVDAGVATVTLARPDARNALDMTMSRELQNAMKSVTRDRDVRALVITGTGKAFCSGQDLKDVTGPNEPDTLGSHLDRTWNPIVRSVYELPKPTIASINGVAAGAGASLALACDLRIAAESAALVIVFSKVGLLPDSGATWLLPRVVGMGKALEMAYLSEPVGATEAGRIGLVNSVVPSDELPAATTELARKLAEGPTNAYALTKRAMDRAWGLTFQQALAYETQLQTAAGRGADYAEGVAAFVEKRAPSFTGA